MRPCTNTYKAILIDQQDKEKLICGCKAKVCMGLNEYFHWLSRFLEVPTVYTQLHHSAATIL